MAILFNIKLFDGSLSGTTAIYSAAEHNSLLAQAEKLLIYVRGAQSSGTSPTATVQVEHSNDNMNFTNKNGTAEVNAQALSTSAVSNIFGSDTGSAVGGAFMRLRIVLGGTGPASNLQVWVCGRSLD